MTITIATKKLIDTLTDALQTADNAVGGIHLSTHRGPWRDEPGNVDLLAFTSTDRWTVGHTWIPIDGQSVAAVWPVESAATVLAICKSLLSRRGKDHTVDVDMVRADPPPDVKDDEHPGWVVSVSETPALFASDTEFQFHAHPEGKFPIGNMRRILAPATELPLEVEESTESALTLWSPGVLAPLVAVAKRRNMQMQFFRSPFRSVQVVQIGDTWLGAAMPGTPLPGDHGEQPSIEPVFAELVSAGADLLRNGSGLVTGDGAE
jgi:S-DNA-T family DNA segregation ATPase FtsK/SpoIIIE